MTKEITKAIVLQELQDKFKLREFKPEKFLFAETVIPTYDIGSHVKGWESKNERLSVTANGSMKFFDVPITEQWRIRRLDVIHETGANFDVDQVFVYSATPSQHQYLFYNTGAPITSGTVKIFELPQDVVMTSHLLPQLYINVSNFVAGGYVSLHMLTEVETIR